MSDDSRPQAEGDAALLSAEDLARMLHDTYERDAHIFGYETRPDTRDFDPETQNGRLMVHVCGLIIKKLGI